MKDAYYFSHDSNARHDPKLGALRAKYGWAGYGLYWAIIECLRDQPDYSYPNGLLYGLALAIGFDGNDPQLDIKFDDFMKILIELKLIKNENGKLFSRSLIERMKALTSYRKRLSEAGKIGAQVRWGSHKGANSLAYDPNSSKVKESKVKESNKEKEGKDSTTASLLNTDFINTLKQNPAYQHIPLDTELLKMDAWLAAHPGRKKTRRFILNWLNKVEMPLSAENIPESLRGFIK